MSLSLNSVDDVQRRLAEAGYVASKDIATSVFLADRLEKPLLVEGPAGVGKTELALAVARMTDRKLIRLQCYEGLDESKALYEWEYAKQLLYTQLLKDRLAALVDTSTSLADAADKLGAVDSVFFSQRFLLPRPLLAALTSPTPALLLIDEVDKSDPEFEAFLLEMLAENAVTVPELGTIRAQHPPRVLLTSNAARELSDALRRRCLHLFVDFPKPERELEIVRARVPDVSESLSAQVVAAVAAIRRLELRKTPAVSETLDWVRALVMLNAPTLDPQLIGETLHVVLKYQTDLQKAREHLSFIAQQAGAAAPATAS